MSAAILVVTREATLAIDPTGAEIVKEERGTVVWKQALPDGTPAVLKLYRHRRPSLGVSLGLERCRAQHEFDALRHAESHGVACSPPLFWAEGVDRVQGRYAILATREVVGASSLEDALRADPDLGRTLDFTALFRLVASMHASGLHHGMLEPRNVLVSGAGAAREFRVIDMPRSLVYGRDVRGTRAAAFDLAVLVWGLARHVDRETLGLAVTGYGAGEKEARAIVRRCLARRMGRRYRNLVRASLAIGLFLLL